MDINIDIFEKFLSNLIVDKSLFYVKTIEFDLKWDLNPTNDLNNLFFVENNFLWFHDFFIYYCNKHKDLLIPLIDKYWREDFLKWLKARLYRTQFGFLTEYHSYFKCLSIFPNWTVLRNSNLDKLWVDFIIKHKNHDYNIHIFVDTERAWYYRNFKSKNKFVDDLPWTHVNFPYFLWMWKINAVKYLPNWFWIYTDKYVNYLKNCIEQWILIWKNIKWVDSNGFILL